ncbi:hypothetical protein GCM10020229_54280 [Kitasatospora albolonga]
MLAFVGVWQFTPLHALIYQGGARAIPRVLYQPAAIDGAGRARQFLHVTLPQLRNTVITSTVLMVVGGLTTFDTVLILTQGGPRHRQHRECLLHVPEGLQGLRLRRRLGHRPGPGGGRHPDLARGGPVHRLRRDALHRGGI